SRGWSAHSARAARFRGRRETSLPALRRAARGSLPRRESEARTLRGSLCACGQDRLQPGCLAIGRSLETPLGHADRGDAVLEHRGIALAVVLEGLAVVVEVPAVALDDQRRLLEVGVDL